MERFETAELRVIRDALLDLIDEDITEWRKSNALTAASKITAELVHRGEL